MEVDSYLVFRMAKQTGAFVSKLIVVNLYGGPGIGKSTLAADVFSQLKRQHVNAELVSEYAKSKVWEKSLDVLRDQIYVLGKQHHRQFILEGHCDVAVTDSPILLSCIYNKMYTNYKGLDAIAVEAFHRFDNMNYVIERDSTYNPLGRVQNEDQAREVDASVRTFLDNLEVSYKVVTLETAVPMILADILKRL